MDEKIKVSLPKVVLDVMKKDCVDFKITKEDGKANFNAFVNLLIANFYETFCAGEEKLYDDIRAALFSVPEFYREDAFKNIVKLFAKRDGDAFPKKDTTTFSFKPTKTSQKAITYIENVVLGDESYSSFYRRLFSAYVGKPKNEREKILFAENFALLSRAASKGVEACVCLSNGDVIPRAAIYAVATSKDELFNYVLLYDGTRNATIRLAKVKSTSLLLGKACVPSKNAELFDRQIACGAQYAMYNTDGLSTVLLTDKGKELFNKIYLYRPTPVKIEGDVYTFDCSANQLVYYFERFGDSALILSPKKLGIFMRNYYYFALKKYKTLYGNK